MCAGLSAALIYDSTDIDPAVLARVALPPVIADTAATAILASAANPPVLADAAAAAVLAVAALPPVLALGALLPADVVIAAALSLSLPGWHPTTARATRSRIIVRV